MHPVHGSDPRMTPFCASEIKALRKCHETSGIMKYFNACNDDKITLNRCLSRDVCGPVYLRVVRSMCVCIKYYRYLMFSCLGLIFMFSETIEIRGELQKVYQISSQQELLR
jgi:hypothetical protein